VNETNSDATARVQDRKTLLVAALMCAIALSALDATIVSTALPTIVGNLGGLSLFSWVFSIYLLASTVTVPLYGKLADLYGRKPVLLFGCSVFLLGSVCCGASQNMEQLILSRAVQGLGAGAVQPVTMTIIGDIFTMEERARIQGLFSSVWGFVSLLGPAIGGIIVDGASWRVAFFLNIPLGLLSMLLIWKCFQERAEKRQKHVIDYWGTVLLSGAVGALLLGVLQSVKSYGWLGTPTLGLFALSAVLLALFIRQEGRAPEPVLPMWLFRNKVIRIASICTFVSGGLMFGINSYVPLFAQGVRGGSAMDAGLIVLPMSVTWPLGSVLAGRIMIKRGYYASAISGALMLVAGSALLVPMRVDTSIVYMLIAGGIVGLGMGFLMPSLIISVQNSVEWGHRGVATATTQFFRTIGGAIWVAVMGAILNSQLQANLAGVPGVPSGVTSETLLNENTRRNLDPGVLNGMQEALANALHEVYLLVLLSAILAAVVVFFFPRGKASDLSHDARTVTRPNEPVEASVGGS
jgi:EmrB/QacA subfamily drug resistance transporter